MSQPSKEQVHKWQQERVKSRTPPPDPKQVRRELGWDLVDAGRGKKRA